MRRATEEVFVDLVRVKLEEYETANRHLARQVDQACAVKAALEKKLEDLTACLKSLNERFAGKIAENGRLEGELRDLKQSTIELLNNAAILVQDVGNDDPPQRVMDAAKFVEGFEL